jgi:hypothetical protein
MMGRLSRTRVRRFLRGLAVATLAIGAVATWALAAGPGGWDHLGTGTHAGGDSLDLVAASLAVAPGALYVGGDFTDAGGVANADRIAKWNGSSWSALSPITNGRVSAIAVSGGKVYAGGSFTIAGNEDANNLAVWDGGSWEPACNDSGSGPAFDANVTSLQIIGQTLYVGGEFHNGAHILSADALLACSLNDGNATSTVADEDHAFTGSVYALTADSNGTLYAGGGFINLNQFPDADNVAALPAGGAWEPMGPGVTTFVDGLTAVGTDVYIGTRANDVAGIAQADHVARWDGSDWHAVGAGSGGANGWFPTTTSINDLAGQGSYLFVAGSFQDAGGDARADNVAFFDGTNWHPLGSDGAGGGPWIGTGLALALVDRQLYAAGSFTSAGGDPQAHSVASFGLSQVIAYPTPTVTPGPSAQPTPTVTPGPAPQPTPTVTPSPTVDNKAPSTSLRSGTIDQAKRKATFRFGSGEKGAKFLCKLDRKKYKPCTSPKTYKKLKRGKHVFRVKARDRAGNVDRTPIVRKFKIKRPG